jgi:transcriptional regulator with XRE-family HTH domain
VDSHLNKGIAHQIRATRDRLEWSQERLAKEVDMSQNAISRLESPDYGKQTITTLKRLAAAFDVGIVVRFVPFSEMVDWVSGTPRMVEGLTTAALAVPSFEREDVDGVFEQRPILTLTPRIRIGAGAANCVQTHSGNALGSGTPITDRAQNSVSGNIFALFSQAQQMVPTSAVHAAEMVIQ